MIIIKQIIPFVKDIDFEDNIYEITSISLEKDLKMENNDSIVGTFVISGEYKPNEISVNDEKFSKTFDFDITLDDKYDASQIIIDIDDFYYEKLDNHTIQVHINVLLDNLLYLTRDNQTENERNFNNINEITDKLIDLKESYSTYKIHIIRDDETIDTVTSKYNVSKEELSKYNDLNNIVIGSKIIIPLINE